MTLRLMPMPTRIFRRILTALCVVAFGVSLSAQTTTFSGIVYSPLGPGTGDPIPNILVFVVNPAYPPPTFSQGQVLGSTCQQQPNLVPAQVLGSGTSAFDGTFSFTVIGPLPTPSVTLVIQAGKWRRQYTYATSSLNQGGTNTFNSLTMPPQAGTLSDGSIADLPYIAVVTGAADGIECIFRQIGILDSNVGAPGSGAHIVLYPANGTANEGAFPIANPPVKELSLVTSPSTLSQYDLVMFGCEGSSGDDYANADANNLTGYVNSGGRVFATHWAYVWLQDNTTFNPVADWSGGGISDNGPDPATINTTTPSFQEGLILGQWMNYIGALTGTPPPYVVGLTNVRTNTTGINAPAVTWANLNASVAGGGQASMQFTFDTPIGAAGTPTVNLTYTNQTPPYLTGDSADYAIVNVTNSSTISVDTSLQLSITVPSGLTPTNAVDTNTTTPGWWCPGPYTNNVITCERTHYNLPLAAGMTDSVQVTFSILTTAQLGDTTMAASLSGGGLSGSSQCGRVLYNDYHVEEPGTKNGGVTSGLVYPNECPTQTTLSNVQKFLEFSLYNLSSFISTTSTDTIDIQGLPVLGWTNPLTTIYYGTTPYTTTQATATYQGGAVAGTFTYNPTLTTILPVGANQQVCVTFVPTVSLDYVSVTTPYCTSITVLPDTTAVTQGAGGSIFYGQAFPVPTPQVTTGGPSTLNEGTVTVTLTGTGITGSVVACTINLASPGTCSALPTLYDAGTYTETACYADSASPADFAPSCAAPVTVVVNPDPTATTLASTPNPSPVNTSITFTATVSDTYYPSPYGSIVFMDGTAVLATVPLASGSTTASYSTASLIVGPHTITACYAPGIDPFGTYDFLTSCSAQLLQEVILVPPPLNTVVVLNSSQNPSIFQTAVTFSAAVATTGSFSSVPVGSISFLDGTTTLATIPLTNGAAQFTTSTLAVGTHPITAVYAGGTANSITYSPATSAVLNQVVTVGLPTAGTGFLLLVNPTAISVGVGNTLTVKVSVVALNNFNQTVKLTCGGLPTEATCAFAQTDIPVGGGITTLTISPSSPHACGSGGPYFIATNGMGTSLPLFALSALGLFFIRKRKRLFQGMALALALCLLPVLNGCSSNCTDFGTQPGTYTFNVTGTAGGAIAPATTPLVVNQTVQMIVHL
jgi:hypothetical protein